MAASIRVSETLYHAAASEAKLMHRSLAMQIEHWASLGRALERAQPGLAQIRALAETEVAPDHLLEAAKREPQKAARREVLSGSARAEELHLIPPGMARRAKIKARKDLDFGD